MIDFPKDLADLDYDLFSFKDGMASWRLAEDHLSQGGIYLESEKYESALKHFMRAAQLKDEPEHNQMHDVHIEPALLEHLSGTGYFNMGVAYLALKNADAAIKSFKQCLQCKDIMLGKIDRNERFFPFHEDAKKMIDKIR
ncbi:MAG: tetratricopeptide repeat protein [Chlorobiales bacterium]|nr:tetratricopeptide repeat protein [Chlorobiales bacterium]